MASDVPQLADALPGGGHARIRRFVYILVLAIVAGQGVANILTATVLYDPARWPENRPPHTPLFSANDRSRWCTVWALVERGTFQIDEIIAHPGWDTIDKVRADGHFYSSKPALLPVVTAAFYWLLKHTTGLNLLTQTHATVHALLLIVNWLPMLASLVVLAAIAERYAQTDWSRYFLVLTGAFGTLLTPFLVTLNNHNIAAASVLFAVYPWLRISIDGQRRWGLFALAGFWGAFAACNELPASAFGGVLFVLLVRAAPAPTIKYFVPAALLPLGAFVFTTRASTGDWLPVYSKFGTEAYRYVVDGIPSYWVNPSGLDRSLEPPLTYLFHCTLGHHGIFTLSPVFLLTAAGWLLVRRLRAAPLRHVCCLSFGLTVWVLAFYLAQTKSYNYGGNTSGLRWAFWLIPFWLIALVPVLDAWGDRRWVQVTSALLLAASTFSATFPHNNPWQKPWLQTLMESHGWVDYDTWTDPFPVPRRAWCGPLPEATPGDAQPWIEFSGHGPLGEPVGLRLQSLARDEGEGEAVRRIEALITGRSNGLPYRTSLTFSLTEEPFATGSELSRVVRPSAGERASHREAALFLQGLPRPVEYRPGSTRYLKTALRTDAFQCQMAAAHVLHRATPDGPALSYRRAVWLCSEVPFGVLQIEDTVLDPRDNAIVFKQRLTAVRTSRLLKPPTAP